MRLNFHEALALYAGHFGDTPTVMGLSEDQHEDAALALLTAIELESPMTDEEFYKAIGLEMPPEGADI